MLRSTADEPQWRCNIYQPHCSYISAERPGRPSGGMGTGDMRALRRKECSPGVPGAGWQDMLPLLRHEAAEDHHLPRLL